MPTALVLGASSGIGQAIARQLGSQAYDLVLAGRSPDALAAQARDLELRFGIRVTTHRFEALDFEHHRDWLDACVAETADGLDLLVLCYGVMAEEAEAARDASVAGHMIAVNLTSPVSLLDRAAEYFTARGGGTICAISSVAGVRGRIGNHHYGASKAGLSTYLSGLRVRLAREGVAVVEIRPGMVDTRMTFGLPGLVLLATPTRVARDVSRGIRRRRAVVYTPGIWRWIMLLIRHLPEFVFKRLPI